MIRRVFMAAAFLALSFVLPAQALELDAARAAGQVVELHNGYLAAGDGAGAEAQSLVASVNAKRKAYYQSVASQQGVSLADVETIFGDKIFQKGQPGVYQRIDGSRVRK